MNLWSYGTFFAVLALINALAVLGLNIQWGLTGLFNAGVVGFMAIGGYTMGMLIGPSRAGLWVGYGLPFPLGLLGAALATAAIAFIIASATVRLRKDYLAIATFGVAITIQLVALNAEPLTGGNQGLFGLPHPFRQWTASPFADNVVYLAIVAIVTALCYGALERLTRSPWGRALRCIRDDELAAASLGKNADAFRLQAFVLGATLMGISGALYAGFVSNVSPYDFLPVVTFQIWTMLIVGGSGSNRGAIAGAVLVWGLWSGSGIAVQELMPPAWKTNGGAVQVILIGLVLIASLLYRPHGLFGVAPRGTDPR
jgi:branched-chain amino acid transport system permease protein